MNEIVNKFLIAGDKFMPEMHLGPTWIYIQCLGTIYKKHKKNSKI